MTLDELTDSITEVVKYNWNDEVRDLEQQRREGEDHPDHLAYHLERLAQFVGLPYTLPQKTEHITTAPAPTHCKHKRPIPGDCAECRALVEAFNAAEGN